MRKVAGHIALILLGLIGGLIIVEASLRILRFHYPIPGAEDPNPWEKFVGWAPGPYRFENKKDRGLLLRYNSKGLRDVEHDYEKPADTYRILVLGDSFVEGRQVELERLFTRILEDLLNENAGQTGLHFEVISAGFGGWGTDQQLLYYENEGYKYSADLVLVSFVFNDVSNNYPPLEKIAQASERVFKPHFTLEGEELALHSFPSIRGAPLPPPSLGTFLNDHSVLYRVVCYQVHEMQERWKERREEGSGVERQRPRPVALLVFADPPTEEYREAWRLMAALLNRLQEDVGANGGELAVVSNSTSFVVYPETREEIFSPLGGYVVGLSWSEDKPDRELGAILEERNVPFLPLLPYFVQRAAESEEPLHLLPADGHYSTAGHRLAAEVICKWLLEEGLVPTPQ
jgi:hypothetical protein